MRTTWKEYSSKKNVFWSLKVKTTSHIHAKISTGYNSEMYKDASVLPYQCLDLLDKITLPHPSTPVVLDITWTSCFDDRCLDIISTKLPTIQSLRITFADTSLDANKISSTGFFEFVESSKCLEELRVDSCIHLDRLVITSNTLKSLVILNAPTVNSVCLDCRELEEFVLDTDFKQYFKKQVSASKACLKGIMSSLASECQIPCLKKLRVSHPNISGYLSSKDSVLVNHPSLESLDLSGASRLTAKQLSQILKYTPLLKNLVLDGVNSINDECIELITNFGANIESLVISSSPSSKPKLSSVKPLERLSKLRKLLLFGQLGYCRGISGVFSFRHDCIEELGLSYCKNISGLELDCSQLKSLWLCECKGFSKESEVSLNTDNLRRIFVSGIRRTFCDELKRCSKENCFFVY